MRVLCFSSFTFSYLNRARVLYRTLRRYHPEWRLVALITDRPPPGVEIDLVAEDFDEIVWFEDLNLADASAWLFGHDIVEACTAVKGPYMHQVCEAGVVDAIVYLDPDTALFNRLDPVIDLLAVHGGVLTPHLLEPEDRPQAILDNELATLRTGIFNLGFVAIRTDGEGAAFARWWNDRLLSYCYDDIPRGLFVDQRWCDHVPAFYETFKVLRDPGYNVASWNLSRRKVTIDWAGEVRVNGSLLRFWHFTKLGPVGESMTRRYAGSNYEVYEIWSWYRRMVQATTDPRLPAGYWAYGTYADGRPIKKKHREQYRYQPELSARFPNPFDIGPESFQASLINDSLI
ncbi:hypothetical protein [Brevundimonas sp. SL161]|uniref:hypothetical protein n=1 Tax=Brevundimonas sp. SL161 TaxID=2804613 RepID=UPI003CED1998